MSSKTLGYQVVRDMRDALLLGEGMGYREFCSLMGLKPSNGKAIKSWKRAEDLSVNQTAWKHYMRARIKNLEAALRDTLDDYVNEGFGYEGLSQDMINILQRSGS